MSANPPTTSQRLLLQGGRILDPATQTDRVGDVLVVDGRIAAIAPTITAEPNDHVMTLTPEHWVTPGLVDIHVHFRDPGQPAKETTLTGAHAAMAGGFTSVCIMPNTRPTLDNTHTLEYVQQAAQQTPVRIFPVCAVTEGLKGERITPMAQLAGLGSVAFTDDGLCVMNAQIMKQALDYSAQLDVPIMQHAEDHNLSGKPAMHAGHVACCLGLPGMSNAAESTIVARDIELARATGGHVHVCHISTQEAVELVHRAQAEGLKVTAEVTPHHLVLTEDALWGYDTDYKMCPPLRAEADRQAVVAGLIDGTIGAIATDHAPHTATEKARPFTQAPMGVVGLETAVGVVLTHLYHTNMMDALTLVSRMTWEPVQIMHLDRQQPGIGRLAVGELADITVIDPNASWVVDPTAFLSKSRNSCFKSMTLTGKPLTTIIAGQVVWQAHNAAPSRQLTTP